jgi:hypothetical protein
MNQRNTTSPSTKKSLDQMLKKIRFKHYSLSTEKAYIISIKHYIIFHSKRHPVDMDAIEVEQFLTYLVIIRHHSESGAISLLDHLK